MRIALPLLALVAFTLPALAADDAKMIAEGKRLAEINCTKCHNIEATGESPLTDSPPFREIAKNYEVDGIVIDWVRFDDYNMDLGNETRTQFRAATGIDPIDIDFCLMRTI